MRRRGQPTFLGGLTARSPCILEITGLSYGQVARRMNGDAVLRFTNDSAFAGAGVVFEASATTATRF